MSGLDLSIIEAGLSTYLLGRSDKSEVWDEIGSTNDRAIELAHSGAPEGTIVLSRQQTGGRGRQGRRWVSPKDAGLFISFILRPTIDASLRPLISFAGGVAAVDAIERLGAVKIGLKWVNDLVFEGKKLGGILAELPGSQPGSEKSGDGWIIAPAVILGLGINLALSDVDLPDELKGRVASLDLICGKKIDRNFLVAELCNALEDQYNHLRHSAQELVLSEWKKHSHTLGKRIRAKIGAEDLEGIAEDLAENGALMLRLDNGELRQLNAGEITIRLDDGRYA